MNLSSLMGVQLRAPSASDPARINQQIAQGGGSDASRDQVSRYNRQKKALRSVGRRMVLERIQSDIGVGRAAAAKKATG